MESKEGKWRCLRYSSKSRYLPGRWRVWSPTGSWILFSCWRRNFLVLRSSVSDPKTLNNAIGLFVEDKPDQPRGVLFKLNGSYYGFYGRALWEWLREDQE